MNQHLHELIARLPALTPCARDIDEAFQLLAALYRADGKLLLCGNGGSCADAEHWSGELLKQFIAPRKLPDDVRHALPDPLAQNLQWGFPAIPLSGFTSLQSAYGNDVDPQYAYAQLTWVLGRPGDALVALSTSGRSPNVCHAASAARARGMAVLAMTGEAGGPLAELADVCVRVPASAVHRVQEYHLPVYHCLCQMLDEAFAHRPVGVEAAARGFDRVGAVAR